ncbi:hypothetical protein RB195_017279 [Necator americanus]|uniref:Endonuclease/exonuclease/phosphatase domain-containing protein n=1 Tax=Necator americanus TaxID=51031 RepID=A0ABR1C619_NECAM
MDSEDELSVSAEPGLTHDILVSHTSVRPKACNQGTGMYKGGGLGSPLTKKPSWSTLRGQTFSRKAMGLEACNLPMGFKNYACHSSRKKSPDSGGMYGTVASGKTGLLESYRLANRKRIRMKICTYNACTLASEPSFLCWTWESPVEGNEIDHIVASKRFCLTDVAVVPEFCTGSDHRLLRGKFSFVRREQSAAKSQNYH